MLDQNARGKSLNNPLVVQAFIWCQPFLGVPLQATRYKVDEARVWVLPQLDHYVADSLFLLVLSEHLHGRWDGVVLELGKQVLPGRAGQHTLVGHADHVYNQLHLLTLVGAREEREACK